MVTDLADYFSKDGIPFHSAIESRYVINPETSVPYTYKSGEPKKLGKASLKKLAVEGIKMVFINICLLRKVLTKGLR